MNEQDIAFQSTTGHSRKYLYGLVAISASILLFLIVLVSYAVRQQSIHSNHKNQAPQAVQTSKKDEQIHMRKAEVPRLPKVNVKSWDMQTMATTIASQSAVHYSLKTNYNQQDFLARTRELFARHPALLAVAPNVQQNEKYYHAKWTASSSAAMVIMDKTNGSLLARFFGKKDQTYILAGTQVQSYIQNTFEDPSLVVTDVYQKPSDETIYYAAHRSWQAMGKPIVNVFGLFNTPDNTALDTLDPSALRTDTSKPRQLRAGEKLEEDFNTVTVGVKNGVITSIVSNLRLFDSASAIHKSNVALVDQQQAQKRLQSSQYEQLFVAPAGSGFVPYDTLYPNSRVDLSTVSIKQAAVAYVESLPSSFQAYLSPSYIFWGESQASSGYTMRVLAVVSAHQDVLGDSARQTHLLTQVAGSRPTQQQATLQFAADPALQPTAVVTRPPSPGTTNTPTPTRTPSPPSACEPDKSQLSNLQTDAVGNQYGQAARPSAYTSVGANTLEWYVVLNQRSLSALNEAISTAFARFDIVDEPWWAVGGQAQRDLDNIIEDFMSGNESCPIRLSGRSPTVFAYQLSKDTFIKPKGPITYSYPELHDGGWSVSDPNTQSFYYEYDNRFIPKTTAAGWIVDRSQLASLVHRLANQLQLHDTEEQRLLFELNHAARQAKGTKVFVHAIDRSELDSALPLVIEPGVNVQRIHFGVTNRLPSLVKHTQLLPVVRSESMVLELGALAY